MEEGEVIVGVTISVTKALTNYFNVEPYKKSASEWLKELKELTQEEKRHLAELVCEVTGDTLAD